MLQKVIYVILGISIAFVFMPKAAKDFHDQPLPSILGSSTKNLTSIKPSPELALNLPPPELSAHAAFAFDLSSKSILFTRNFDEKVPVASLTKLMTALAVVKSTNTENLVEVRADDVRVVGNNMGLAPNEKISVLNLLKGMLISSSNDAAQVLASYVGGSKEVFTALMNEEANKLNLHSTNFTNPVGWDSDENYSTASDLAVIVEEFLKYDLLSTIVQTAETEVFSFDNKYRHVLRTTNKLLLEDPKVTGVKTGFTSQAKGNLVIRAGSVGQEVIIIVLGSENREEDSRKLLDWIFQVYRW